MLHGMESIMLQISPIYLGIIFKPILSQKSDQIAMSSKNHIRPNNSGSIKGFTEHYYGILYMTSSCWADSAWSGSNVKDSSL